MENTGIFTERDVEVSRRGNYLNIEVPQDAERFYSDEIGIKKGGVI